MAQGVTISQSLIITVPILLQIGVLFYALHKDMLKKEREIREEVNEAIEKSESSLKGYFREIININKEIHQTKERQLEELIKEIKNLVQNK